MDRRRFLIMTAAGGAWFTGLWTLFSKYYTPDGPRPLHVENYLQFGDRSALEIITPVEDFYITSKGLAPSVDPSAWQLTIDGLVERPLTLDLQELQRLVPLNLFELSF